MLLKKVTINFDNMWVLSKKDDDVLPVQVITDRLKKRPEVEVLYTSLACCEFVVKDSKYDEKALMQMVNQLLTECFSIDESNDAVEVLMSDYVEKPEQKSDDEAEDEITEAPSKESKSAVPEDNFSERAAEEILEKIDKLIGADEFKAIARECVRIAPGIRKYKTYEAFNHQSYIFSINDGNGLTTYLELFAELLEALGLFEFAQKEKVVEEKILPPFQKESSANPFSSVLSHFQRFKSKKGRIICIDISEWMTKTGEKEFRDFLQIIDDHAGENIVVFRIPFVEKEILLKIKRSLGDILFIRDISFVPFDLCELTRCAEESLDSLGFSMEDSAWEIFNARIAEEKVDGRFYGINTVNKVIREMIYRKQLDNALNDVDDTVIKKSEILGLAENYSENEKSGLNMLDDFVGMENLKHRVEEIVAQIEMSLKNNKLGSPCIHMRFVGNPGTGKTTVARVIGKILKEKGILRNGNFFEYSGRDFCGRYVGETAPKTSAMCRDAYGSVMFIDEAYSLYRGDSYSNVDYGREAIDTLVAEMENHRSDLVVIMAGYPDEMNNLMKSNAGLESRMPYIIEFPNYSREQLFEIFMLMTKNNFKYHGEFESAVKDYFNSLPDEVIEAKEFSNARFVRNLFERTWGKAVLRTQMSKADSITLLPEDFIAASSEKEFKKIMEKQNRTLGFV